MAALPTPQGGAGTAPDAEELPGAVLTEKTLTYRVVRFSVSVALRTLFGARFRGGEHLPPAGGALIAANHQSYLDIPLVASATRRHVAFVARDTLAESRPLGWLMRQCGAVLIRRGRPDRPALREMVAHLEAGDVVCVFPEGTRSRDRSVGAFRGGALLAARLARVPIVPAAVGGTFDAWPRGGRLRLARVSLAFGEPLDPLAADAEHVRQRILALIEAPR